MRAVDGNNATALTTSGSAFKLAGGKYLIIANCNSGSALIGGLQALSANGTSFVAVHTAFAHVSGVATVDLPPGTYKWVVSGTPGASETFDLSVFRVPGD
jgi:hypothetical protein